MSVKYNKPTGQKFNQKGKRKKKKKDTWMCVKITFKVKGKKKAKNEMHFCLGFVFQVKKVLSMRNNASYFCLWSRGSSTSETFSEECWTADFTTDSVPWRRKKKTHNTLQIWCWSIVFECVCVLFWMTLKLVSARQKHLDDEGNGGLVCLLGLTFIWGGKKLVFGRGLEAMLLVWGVLTRGDTRQDFGDEASGVTDMGDWLGCWAADQK